VLGVVIPVGFESIALSDEIVSLNPGMVFEVNDSIPMIRKKIDFSLSFSKPAVHDRGRYVNVIVEGINSYRGKCGTPVLPVCSKTLVFPFGTRIISVECIPLNQGVVSLDKKVIPASELVIVDGRKHLVEIKEDKEIYNCGEIFPGNWFSYRVGAGLKDRRHVVFLSIHIYPVRYVSLLDLLCYTTRVEVEVIYEEPSEPVLFPDEYDLLVIAPSSYTVFLRGFVKHKAEYGIESKIVTLPEIFSTTQGRDRAEKIKYFIKYAVETWGVRYVLLVGGDDRIPVRRVYTYEGVESSFMSDLYYADLYFPNGSFSSWDTNRNSYFGEYNHSGKNDVMDLYPDVYLARLPCRHILEVFFVVNKLVRYETTPVESWFDRFVLCAGDSFDDSFWGTDYIEGEITTEKALEYMEGFKPVRIYASLETLSTENILREFNKGAGFMNLEGHGNYLGWATHPIHDYNTWIGFSVYHIPDLKNDGRLPVVVVGGCYTSNIGYRYECFGWRLVWKINGGAIATTGYTSLSWGGDDDVNGNGEPDIIEYASGLLNTLFFKKYGMEGKEVLGEVFAEAIAEYLNRSPVEWNEEFLDVWDCKTVESWILFGDPTLKIGGYS
jgi:hypothetical protein